jgi:hypothetical protein
MTSVEVPKTFGLCTYSSRPVRRLVVRTFRPVSRCPDHLEIFEAERKAAEVRIRAERRAGELLIEMKQNGERQKQGEYKKSNDTTFCTAPKLSDLGITRDESSKWQQLAAVPKVDFERARAGLNQGAAPRAALGSTGDQGADQGRPGVDPNGRESRGGSSSTTTANSVGRACHGCPAVRAPAALAGSKGYSSPYGLAARPGPGSDQGGPKIPRSNRRQIPAWLNMNISGKFK